MLQNEMHEYEQFSRRIFFEKVLEGKMSVKEIYDEAAKLEMELTASSYNLIFIYLQEHRKNQSELEVEQFLRQQEEILHYFLVSTVSGIPVECKLLWSLNKIRSG